MAEPRSAADVHSSFFFSRNFFFRYEMDTSEVYVLREVALYSRQWSGAMMALGYIQLIEPSRLIIAAGVTKNRKPCQQSPPPGMYVRATCTEITVKFFCQTCRSPF